MRWWRMALTAGVALVGLAGLVGLVAGSGAAAGAAAPASGRVPATAVLLSLQPGSRFPADLQLTLAPAAASSWTVGLDFARDRRGLQSVWGRRVWRLNPDVLALVGVQAGFNLQDEPQQLPRGAWVGFYLGERWVLSPLVLELGTAVRFATGEPYRVAWKTSASVGLGW